MAISSTGLGSGLDVTSIISQLSALEKQPLKALQSKAQLETDRISAVGQIQSQMAALADVSTRLSAADAWVARKAQSSNTSAATITTTNSAPATSFQLDVDALATSQSITSAGLSSSALVGAGTLTFRRGTWESNPSSFTPDSTSSNIPVVVSATDTVATLAARINAASVGVVAMVFKDGVNDRLQLTSKATGANAGFRVQVTDSDGGHTDNAGLSRFGFDPQSQAFDIAASYAAPQYGQDARARINGITVTSSTNTLTDNIPGVTISLLATTTTGLDTLSEKKSPVSMVVSEDVTVAVKNVNDFVTAYNALTTNLTNLTKYDQATKTASLFQGDSTVVGIQNMLRSISSSISSGSVYQRLSDVGLEKQTDGTLTVKMTKLSAAINNGLQIQKFFTQDNKNTQTNGFALKFAAFAKGANAISGAVTNKNNALKKALDTNSAEQQKVNDRAAATEARLKKQYSALDSKMASLTALNSYVSQQVTTWNKSTR